MTPERLAEIRLMDRCTRESDVGMAMLTPLESRLSDAVHDCLAHIDALEKEAAVGREASRAILRVAMELPPYEVEEEQPGA